MVAGVGAAVEGAREVRPREEWGVVYMEADTWLMVYMDAILRSRFGAGGDVRQRERAEEC